MLLDVLYPGPDGTRLQCGARAWMVLTPVGA